MVASRHPLRRAAPPARRCARQWRPRQATNQHPRLVTLSPSPPTGALPSTDAAVAFTTAWRSASLSGNLRRGHRLRRPGIASANGFESVAAARTRRHGVAASVVAGRRESACELRCLRRSTGGGRQLNPQIESHMSMHAARPQVSTGLTETQARHMAAVARSMRKVQYCIPYRWYAVKAYV